MAFTRRFFIRQVAVAGPVVLTLGFERDVFGDQCGIPSTTQDCSLPTPPPATRFIPNEAVVRTRYSALEMADSSRAAQLQQFRDGICLIRNLPPTDVLSWTKLVAQHCLNCARSNTSNIHYDQQFLPWHRAMLYFLERSMRKLSGNDDIRLVYWDWENPRSRVLPSIYAPTNQPLYWSNRGDLSGPQWPLTYDQTNVQPLLAIPTFRDFGGSARQRDPVPAAYSGPHANVHNNFSPGDMGDLQYSPRDPVFYAHHSNIDRLWSSWVAAGHSNPDFGDARVFFYDETRTWKYVLMNDLRDTRKLGYEYSSLMQRRSPRRLRATAAPMDGNRITLSSVTAQRLATPAPEFLLIRNIRNLDQFPHDAVTFGIFTSRPAVGTDAGSTVTFLGAASRVRHGDHDGAADPLSASLDISNRLSQIMPNLAGSFDLFIAPIDMQQRTTAEAIPLEADSISIIAE